MSLPGLYWNHQRFGSVLKIPVFNEWKLKCEWKKKKKLVFPRPTPNIFFLIFLSQLDKENKLIHLTFMKWRWQEVNIN